MKSLSRVAILVACDPYQTLSTQYTCDLENWYNFLQTPYGGAWNYKTEIRILCKEDATSEAIRKSIADVDANYDYAFICFSGHGYIGKGFDVTYIQTNDKIGISETLLDNINSRCQRKTIFLDCCRTSGELPKPGKRIKASRLSEDDISRLLFSWLISKSLPGCVKIYSASPGEEAEDCPSFTDSFFKSMGNLMPTIKGPFLDNRRLFCFARRLFHCNLSKLQKKNYPNPQYLISNKYVSFPIVINPLWGR